MNKYILILGAGLMQKPAIIAAKELGYLVALVDGNKNALCVNLADCFKPIDLKDKESILAFATELQSQNQLAAIFTAGTDFSAVVSYVSEKLKLPAHSYQAACNASNKILMRRCFEQSNVPSPKFIEVDSSFLQNANLGKLQFPLVVKPVDNMGARGCRMIRNQNELHDAVKIAIDFSRTGKAILEEYMEGPEFSIDALVFNGEVTITGFADRHIYYAPYFIEMGHTMPTAISETQWNELAKTFADGINALGLTHGVAKADIKYTKNGPMIGEIAARLSGGYMSGWTFPYSSNLFLTKEALLLALNKIPADTLSLRRPTENQDIFNVPSINTSAERAYISIPGIVKKVHDFSAFNSVEGEQNPTVKDFFPRCKEGDAVKFPENNVEKCGNVISVSSDYSKAIEIAEDKIKSIVLELEPNNSETVAFLEHPLNTEFPPSAFKLPNEIYAQIEKIEQSQSQIDFKVIPDVLQPFLCTVKDYNKRTIAETLELYKKIKNPKSTLVSNKFYRYLIRGGIQGILYIDE